MHMFHNGNVSAILARWFGGFYVYGDLGYPITGNILSGWKGNNLTPAQSRFNGHMAKVRIAIEQAFGKWVSTFSFLQHHQNIKARMQNVPVMHMVTMLLTNCHTCLYGHTSDARFDVDPPTLEEYLSDFNPEDYLHQGIPV
jgi:hypothetical protein